MLKDCFTYMQLRVRNGLHDKYETQEETKLNGPNLTVDTTWQSLYKSDSSHLLHDVHLRICSCTQPLAAYQVAHGSLLGISSPVLYVMPSITQMSPV